MDCPNFVSQAKSLHSLRVPGNRTPHRRRYKEENVGNWKGTPGSCGPYLNVARTADLCVWASSQSLLTPTVVLDPLIVTCRLSSCSFAYRETLTVIPTYVACESAWNANRSKRSVLRAPTRRRILPAEYKLPSPWLWGCGSREGRPHRNGIVRAGGM